MNDTLTQAIQEWHTQERQNAAAYDALAAGADVINWPGLTAWCANAANDEREHAAKVAGYLVDKNIAPEFQALEAVTIPTGDDHIAYFQAAMAREVQTTAMINEVYGLAIQADEYDAAQFMLWFLEEQRKSIREITDYQIMLKRGIDRLLFDQSLK